MIGLASASAILLLISLVGIASNVVALVTVHAQYIRCSVRVARIVQSGHLPHLLRMVFSCHAVHARQRHRVFFDSELSKKVGQVTLFFLYGSMYTHLAVSFNRMMSVMFPLRYLLMFDVLKSAALISFVWIGAFLEIVPYFWSDECYFSYKNEVALWKFAATECGEFFGFYFDFLISIVVVFFILAMDVIALLKLRASHKGAYISAMTTEQRKARKIEFVFFVQSLCQTVPFLIAALCFHVVSRYAETDWQLFWATTFSWVSLHTIDGFIIDIFHTRRSVFTWKMKIIPSISFSSSSQGNRSNTMESRL